MPGLCLRGARPEHSRGRPRAGRPSSPPCLLLWGLRRGPSCRPPPPRLPSPRRRSARAALWLSQAPRLGAGGVATRPDRPPPPPPPAGGGGGGRLFGRRAPAGGGGGGGPPALTGGRRLALLLARLRPHRGPR